MIVAKKQKNLPFKMKESFGSRATNVFGSSPAATVALNLSVQDEASTHETVSFVGLFLKLF
ncbi:hypothetical protein [Paenibacillus cremeus]|uniref:hypothetical protein n=1 Tax=Paenibacillus cremeus TaxID=2163881 RepID=UPI001648995D|nr:hypothetical protein [Paenibacillus cremeus]